MHVRVALRRSVGHLLVAVATGLALLGASCTRDAAPPTASVSATPTATPTTPSPTPTPTTPPPTLPTTAHANTPAAAESFARYWLTALDYAYQTGNTTPLKELGDCNTCLALANGIRKLYEEGGHFEGGRLEPVASTTSKFNSSQGTQVLVYYSRSERRAIRGDGQVEVAPSTSRIGLALELVRRGGGWRVTRVQSVEEG